MSGQELRNYIDDLLAERQPRPFAPDEFEAAQIRTAIELAAARDAAADPRPEFLEELRIRLSAGTADPPPGTVASPSRRQVIVGTTAAATAAVAAFSVDRLLSSVHGADLRVAAGGEVLPTDGSWQRVSDAAELREGEVRAFDLGSVSGFVRRVNGRVEAVSGVCTHQGCRLWWDQAAVRLRCPCHSTSFSPAGDVLTHALPVAPKPLPHFGVRERDGAVEVLAPVNKPT